MDNNQIVTAIPHLITSKAEHLPTEWKQPVSGEESLFLAAINSSCILKLPVENLNEALRYAMVKVGLRAKNFPCQEETDVLINHIVKEYGKHTPNEVRLAFDMAIAGKLDIEEKEVKCYENFSCLYFSTIMNAYRKWASQTHKHLKNERPLAIEGETEMSTMEMIDWIEEWRKRATINLLLIPLPFYDFLVKTDQITVSKEEKFEWMAKAAQAIKTELLQALPECKTTDAARDWAAFNKMEKEGFTGDFKTRIINRAQRLIVYEYLTRKSV